MGYAQVARIRMHELKIRNQISVEEGLKEVIAVSYEALRRRLLVVRLPGR